MGAFTAEVDPAPVEPARARYVWPSEPPDEPNRICPVCERLISRVLSCSCSRQAFFGRAVIGSIMRGPE